MAVPFNVVPFTAQHLDTWEVLAAESPTTTFLNSQHYLSYHSARFDDRSMLIVDQANYAVAAFPAASDPADRAVVVSHPRLTYGGLIVRVEPRGDALRRARHSLVAHFRALGFQHLRYKVVPWIYTGALFKMICMRGFSGTHEGSNDFAQTARALSGLRRVFAPPLGTALYTNRNGIRVELLEVWTVPEAAPYAGVAGAIVAKRAYRSVHVKARGRVNKSRRVGL